MSPLQIFRKNTEEVLSDRSSGSSEIISRFIEEALRYAEVDGAQWSVIESAADELQRTFPHFATAAHLADGIRDAVVSVKLREFLVGYSSLWYGVNLRVADRAMQEINPGNATILMHSRSGALLSFAETASRLGRQVRIVQTESQPGGEGIEQSKHLARTGLEVKLIHDLAVGTEIEHVDMVLVGADWVGQHAFINKIGTRAIATLCQYWKRPLYVLGDSRKKRHDVPKPDSDLFEATELSWVTRVITE